MATSGIASLNPDHMRNFDAACLALKARNDAKPKPWERRRGCRTGMYVPTHAKVLIFASKTESFIEPAGFKQASRRNDIFAPANE